METSAQTGHEMDIEPSLHSSIHLSRRANVLTSPLLRLPTELILWIFLQTIGISSDDGRPVSLVLTAICHRLREIGINSPQLWGTVDLTTPFIADLFLERCKRDPHTLKKAPPTFDGVSMYPVEYLARMNVVWEKLEGCTFNALRSVAFEGIERELTRRVVGILRRAPNVSNLDLRICRYCHIQDPLQPPLRIQELLWPIGDPISNLSALRLRNLSISWTSPLLRNLSKLVLEFVPPNFPSEHTPVNVFLTALANCPNLEILDLAHTGPELLVGHQDDCDTVVQLRRLRELSLEFLDHSRVGYILSHVWYPQSAKLAVYVPAVDTGLSEIISQVLPPRNNKTIEHIRKSTNLTIHLGDNPSFFIDNLLVYFGEPDFCYKSWEDPVILICFASKIVEIVGADNIISLNVEAREINPPEEVWETLLRGLPRLELIHYDLTSAEGDCAPLDFFALVFSQPHEGGPICPQLQHLELPMAVLAHDLSATVLKRALAERDACGRRLKRIGVSGGSTEGGDRLVLESFRGLVDDVQ